MTSNTCTIHNYPQPCPQCYLKSKMQPKCNGCKQVLGNIIYVEQVAPYRNFCPNCQQRMK